MKVLACNCVIRDSNVWLGMDYQMCGELLCKGENKRHYRTIMKSQGVYVCVYVCVCVCVYVRETVRTTNFRVDRVGV